jgi:phospholipase C
MWRPGPLVTTAGLLAGLGACDPPPTEVVLVADAGVQPPVMGDLEARRGACAFHAGALSSASIDVPAAWPTPLPITHIIVVVQENHSYDSYFGRLAATLQPAAEPMPADFPDGNGGRVQPRAQTSTCLTIDPPHQWNDAHLAWNNGRLDGFMKNGGMDSLTYFDESLMPFYYWLASTYTIADRYFAPVLAGTWANRDYLYAGTSRGVVDSFTTTIPNVPTIFSALSMGQVTWGVYTDGEPFQDTLGWDRQHGGVYTFEQFVSQTADGTLPSVAFVDPPAFSDQDEHPSGNADLQKGQDWSRQVYQAVATSPLWGRSVLFLTWDEWGGFFDHVPPPIGCIPTPDQPDFDRLGFRIGFIAVSPWVKAHSVSHVVHSHTSVTRFIELIFGLPALTDRDANADALLDMFDFTAPQMATAPTAPMVEIPNCQ